MPLGNTIKLNPDVNESEDTFLVNSISKYIHCISVLAKRVRNKQRTIVRFEEVEK